MMNSHTALCMFALAALAATAVAAQSYWQPDEFPISYWYGPPPAFNKLETWQRVKEANFTVCGAAGGYTLEQNRQMLALCRQLGLKALIHDSRLDWRMAYDDDWQQQVAAVVADYRDETNLYGYFLKDEPNSELFPALARLHGELQRLDPQRLPYINLFPTYASVKQLGAPSYADHVERYLTTVKPLVLSYDHYCLLKDGKQRPDYFENLGIIRELAQQHGAAPWNIILSLPHFGYRDPTAADMRWQVYTSLAYGMKGILYFTYWTHPDWEKEGHVGIVHADGSPGRLYPIVQRLNHEMRTLGKTLLGLTSTGVFHTGPIPQGARRLGGDAIVQLAGDEPLVIGLFRDTQGTRYVMVVNNDHVQPIDFSIRFRVDVTAVERLSADDGSTSAVPLEKNATHLKLAAGDGTLLRLTTHFDYPKPATPLDRIDFRFDESDELTRGAELHSLSTPNVSGGVLTLTFTGEDPYVARRMLRIETDRYSKLRLRMKLPPCQPTAQVFWTTSDSPRFADDKYVNFPVIPDGQWHEYTIPVGDHSMWKGHAIRAIRLDPTTGGANPGDKVQIEWLVGEPGAGR